MKTGSSSSSTQSHPEEKKEEDYTAAAQAAADVAVEQVKPQKATSSGSKKAFTKSKKFGGDGGGSFDHGNHPAVAKISVRHDGHAVHQLTATYEGANKICSGSEKGDDNVEMNFKAGEYVNKVTVRHNKYIQCLTFETNTGRTLGPAGGKGWRLLGKDKEGDEETITAPNGYKLAGFSGACGNYIDSLVIHWGPVA